MFRKRIIPYSWDSWHKKPSVYAQSSLTSCKELTCPAPEGQRGWIRAEPLNREREQTTFPSHKMPVRPVPQLWWIMSRGCVSELNWTVAEQLDSQPEYTHWIEFDCNLNILFSLAFWVYCFFASLMVKSQNPEALDSSQELQLLNSCLPV